MAMPWLFLILLTVTLPLPSEALNVRGHLLKSETFLSPAFVLRPGSVSNKWHYDIAFPRGHLALKSFNGEVVDERGVPVPLHEVYLHHWVVAPYFAPSKVDDGGGGELPEMMIPEPNSGVCADNLHQYYGLGSETRRTATWVPDPYGIEIGDPARAPEGYEERWLINVHAIDTRGVADADKLACTECRCDLYNVTADEHGRRIEEEYTGGLRCCYDQTRCRLAEDGLAAAGDARKLFFRYTVMWLDWSEAVVPVKIYIFDSTYRAESGCKVEYQVDECTAKNRAKKNGCVHVMTSKQVLPRGGDVVFGIAHQHSGGIGASLHGQDGRLLCASTATYGTGTEAGDEAGYIVGMSACYPEPGAVTVRDGETLTVVSNYSSERQHTGVMGLFYILVAEHEHEQEQQKPAANYKPALCFRFPVSWCLPAWLSINQ